MDTLEKYCKKLKLGSEILEEYESIPVFCKAKFPVFEKQSYREFSFLS
ncbi:MAG: hypothetical protein RR557_08725 [Bacilli bacterium]